MDLPERYFRLHTHRTARHVTWLHRGTVYRGKLVSMTNRVVRLFAPDPSAGRPHADVSYDCVTPVRHSDAAHLVERGDAR